MEVWSFIANVIFGSINDETTQNTVGQVWVKDSEPLSRGGFGFVCKWTNSETLEQVAIKRFFVRQTLSSQEVEKYSRKCIKEVDRIAKLSHASIVTSKALPRPLEIALEDEERSITLDEQKYTFLSKPVLCMEFCDGGDLRRLLREPENLSGLQEGQVRRILDSVCQALIYLHRQNVIHRDIKPENILLCKAPNGQVAYKVGDFGLSRDLPYIDKSFSSRVGTTMYRAPEISLRPKTNYKGDYWSFGMTVIEIMYGSWDLRNTDLDKMEEIPSQHHLSPKFCEIMQIWLDSVLDMSPETRGAITNEMKALVSEDCETTLDWMIEFLKIPVVKLEPNIYMIVDSNSECVGAMRERMIPPLSPFKADFVVAVKQNSSPFVVKSMERCLSFTQDMKDVQLFAFSRDSADAYTVHTPGLVHDLLRGEFHKTEENVQKLWIDILFYCQNEMRLVEAYLRSLQAVKILKSWWQRPIASHWSDNVNIKLLCTESVENFADRHTIGEDLRVMECVWNTLNLYYKIPAWKDMNQTRLSQLKQTMIKFVFSLKNVMDRTLSMLHHFTLDTFPPKNPRSKYTRKVGGKGKLYTKTRGNRKRRNSHGNANQNQVTPIPTGRTQDTRQ